MREKYYAYLFLDCFSLQLHKTITVLTLVILGTLLSNISLVFATSEQPSSQALKDHFVSQQWKGDFDGMVDRHEIRVLVLYSKTFYFIDKGQQRGLSYDRFKEFEKFVNKKLGTNKALHVKIVFVPVRRDELIPKLVEGYGDIASSVAELATTINDMTKNINEVAQEANQVSANIQSVTQAAMESNFDAHHVNDSAEELAKLAERLRELSQQFKVEKNTES